MRTMFVLVWLISFTAMAEDPEDSSPESSDAEEQTEDIKEDESFLPCMIPEEVFTSGYPISFWGMLGPASDWFFIIAALNCDYMNDEDS